MEYDVKYKKWDLEVELRRIFHFLEKKNEVYSFYDYCFIYIVGSQIAAKTQRKWVISPIQ